MLESYFYPLRITGKSWSQIPEIRQYVTNLIARSEERNIPKDSVFYGQCENYPITLSFHSLLKENEKIELKKEIDVILIDDQQVIIDFQDILNKYGFRTISLNDVQIALKEMGLKGYLTNNYLIILHEEFLDK